jgi:hypothetical protein
MLIKRVNMCKSVKCPWGHIPGHTIPCDMYCAVCILVLLLDHCAIDHTPSPLDSLCIYHSQLLTTNETVCMHSVCIHRLCFACILHATQHTPQTPNTPPYPTTLHTLQVCGAV